MKLLHERKLVNQIYRAIVLLVLDVLYLALVAVTFITKVDLAADIHMQYILHITVILSAFAYLFFVEMIYRTESDTADGRLAFVFSCLFTIPILIGRGIGMLSISQNGLNVISSVYNFYASVSISRTIEIISWTTFFPISVLFMGRVFYKGKGRIGAVLSGLCFLSSICCFIAFMSIISSRAIYFWIGMLGWGLLFLLIIIFYIYFQILKIAG